MKKLDAFKLSLLAASVAGLGVGCASSGYARMDNDRGAGGGMSADVAGVGASASADVGTDRSTDRTYTTSDTTTHRDMMSNDRHYNRYTSDNADHDGSARITVSALSAVPETRATWVNKFPFYDWNLHTIDTYTFAVPDPQLHVGASSDLPQFSVNLPPGSVFVESAGGAGEVRTGRVIQHSPNPR
jgi:hypothetical protein